MIDVTCALIRNEDGLVLAMRRGQGMSNAGKWEFPGGKTREGEDHEDCIVREIDEELGICIIITGTLEPVEHDYGDREIRLIPFLCETLASKPDLREHDDYRWMKPRELVTLDMTAADVFIAQQYAEHYRADDRHESGTDETVVIDEPGDELAGMLSRIFSVEEITMVAHSAARDSSLLSQLVALSSSRQKRVGFMASWALSKVSDMDPAKLTPWLGLMIDALPSVPNESVQRSFLRVIFKSNPADIPESHHSKLIDYCMTIMRQENTPVAPRAYAMEILASFCTLYPGMVNEVSAAVQLAITDASGGMKAAGRKVIHRLGNRE
jgi:8-oxo-dGTP diphosphatase